MTASRIVKHSTDAVISAIADGGTWAGARSSVVVAPIAAAAAPLSAGERVNSHPFGAAAAFRRRRTTGAPNAPRRRPTMKLYYHPVSTVSRPIVLFAADNGIALDFQVVDILNGEHMRRPTARSIRAAWCRSSRTAISA